MRVTRTSRSVCCQVPLHALLTCWPPVGQVKASVQPSIAASLPFVIRTSATNPLPQSLTSENVTVHPLDAGDDVVNVTGADGTDVLPAASRAITLTVYRV